MRHYGDLPILLTSLLLFSGHVLGESFFFDRTGGLGPDVAPISDQCYAALNASIACEGSLLDFMTSDSYAPIGNKTLQDQLCAASCGTALTSYRSAVVSACANDPQPFPGLPAVYWVDAATSVYNLYCLKDASTGAYCTDAIKNLTTLDDGTDPLSLPADRLCIDCVIKVFKQIQSTPYSNYDAGLAQEWAAIQSKCGVSAPTEVPTLATNITDPAEHADPYEPPPCLSGKTYTVVSGDNCLAIAHNHHVSTGSLIASNSLLPDCTNLLLEQVLCIPPTCQTYTVQSGDTCDKIAASQSITFQQIVGWNPTINTYCTNLIADQDICVSPPGGAVSLTTIDGATPPQTAIYASTTVAPPGPAASGTTRDCGKWYLVQPGDFCQLVALNKTIDLVLFLSINPSLDSSCSNLVAGVYYCVQPTADWDSTTTSTVISPPAPTPSGTTPECYEWYVIQSGDYCGLIENNFDITMAQLQLWNPSLEADCRNLVLGEAYCVHGAQQPDGFARVGRRLPTAVVTGAPDSESDSGSLVDTLVRRLVGLKARRPPGPVQTEVPVPAVGGGVPRGWPGLNSPRMAMGEGAKVPDRGEL